MVPLTVSEDKEGKKRKMTCYWYAICPLRRWERQGVISEKWSENYCSTESHWKSCRRYQLEQQGIPHDQMLPDGSRLADVSKENAQSL
ncbi:uncharacterized protein Dvar_65550 [Desulfosarcina variabilis str. Montpellier]